MFVHGIGFHEEPVALQTWVGAWSDAIKNSSKAAGFTLEFDDPLGVDGRPDSDEKDPGILYYEKLVRDHGDLNAAEYLAAVGGLLKDWITTEVGGVFGRDRDLFGIGIPEEVKWKAREVAVWAYDDKMRAALRKKVVAEITAKKPDVVIAHSYGGLITYDACIFEKPDLLKDRYFVTIGTQIGHPVLRQEYGGRQIPVQAKHWFNLYNPGDKVFVKSLEHIKAPNFTNLRVAHPNGHDGASYLGHEVAATQVWRVIRQGMETAGTGSRSLNLGALSRTLTEEEKPTRVRHRALLIGIDEYASVEVPPLKGCVNDTFQLSAALQEFSGFDPKAIRMLHNRRATKDNILAQLQWLLADVEPGDHRFFSFSGHGHRLASYDAAGFANEMEEILVTHEYDFTSTTGLRDRDFQDLYAYLDKRAHFLIFLDCCHAGGVTRDGGPAVRSFVGPSDVEHEYKRWNSKVRMWEQEGLAGKKGLNESFLPKAAEYNRHTHGRKKTQQELDAELSLWYGTAKDTRRIGRATPLRDLPHKAYDAITARLRKLHGEVDVSGPYLPTVFMACGEAQKASEYVHGSVSYGAYTYAMTLALSEMKGGSFNDLHGAASRKLAELGYSQTPEILGNPQQLNAEGVVARSGQRRSGARTAAPSKPAKAKKARKTTARKAVKGKAGTNAAKSAKKRR